LKIADLRLKIADAHASNLQSEMIWRRRTKKITIDERILLTLATTHPNMWYQSSRPLYNLGGMGLRAD
jgi:hypothetical protein